MTAKCHMPNVDPNFALILEQLCERPAMFIGCNTIFGVSTYLAGYCDAHERANVGSDPMRGFFRWIEMRFVVSSPAWHWTRILLHEYGTEAHCIAALPKLYSEFKADLATHGLDWIHSELHRRLVERYGQTFGSPDNTKTDTNLDLR